MYVCIYVNVTLAGNLRFPIAQKLVDYSVYRRYAPATSVVQVRALVFVILKSLK